MALFLLLGCGSSSSLPTVTVTVTSSGSVPAGLTLQFAATVTGSSNTAVSWSVLETAGGTISSSGLYTAPSTAGTYHVIATSVANPADSGKAAVTVSSAAVNISAMQSGSLSTALSGLAPANGQAALGGLGAAWALTAGVQATPVTVPASVVAAPKAQRSANISGGTQADAFAYQVTLNNAVTLSNTPAATTVFSGVLAFVGTSSGTEAALAFGPPQTSPTPISPAAGYVFTVAANATVDAWLAAAGSESATLMTPPGTTACTNSALLPAFVTCTQQNFSGAGLYISASTPLTAGVTGTQTAGPYGPTALVGVALTVDCSQTSVCGPIQVSLDASTLSLPPSGAHTFTATVMGNLNQAVIWSLVNAAGTPVTSGAGTLVPSTTGPTAGYTAPATPGTYYVRASSMLDTNDYAQATVTVTAPAISVTLTPASASITSAQTQPFTATVTGTANTAVTWSIVGLAGAPPPAPGTDGTLVVSTSDPNMATYTPPTTPACSSTVSCNYYVQATSQADSNAFAIATVAVAEGTPVVVVTISPQPPINLLPGQTQLFTATVTGTANTAVTWATTAPLGSLSTTGPGDTTPSRPPVAPANTP